MFLAKQIKQQLAAIAHLQILGVDCSGPLYLLLANLYQLQMRLELALLIDPTQTDNTSDLSALLRLVEKSQLMPVHCHQLADLVDVLTKDLDGQFH